MTDGPPESGGSKRDNEAPSAPSAPAPEATSAPLASATEGVAAHGAGTETEDTAARSAGESDDDDEDEDDEEDDRDEDEEEDDEDEEPKLKYARLTPHLGAVYRNGDATSSFLVAGDKMIIGTHNGNIVSFMHTSSAPSRQLTCL